MGLGLNNEGPMFMKYVEFSAVAHIGCVPKGLACNKAQGPQPLHTPSHSVCN